LLGPEEVRGKWGVDAQHIADVLTLTGDASDNIPGVPGIGDKTAVSLINTYGAIEGILENPTLVENIRQREKLLAHRDLIIANREMVRLDEDLAMPVPWQSFEITPKPVELLTLLRDCEFRTLIKEIEAEFKIPAAENPPAPTSQGELF